jgi:AcrR family transcriptional regulator
VATTNSDRRAIRHAATRDEIIEAAWTLARTHGLATLSMRDLADAVGMRAPSLYQYFGSKLEIYDAMFGYGMREAVVAVSRAIDAVKPDDALRECGRSLITFATSDPVRAQLLFQRTIPDFEPSPESYAPGIELRARAQQLIVDRGITDPDALDMWTALISGLVNQQLANDPGGKRWTRLLDRTVEMFLAHFAPAPARARPATKPRPATKR